MPLIYITGVSGSGKSAVQQRLSDCGYAAYDADDNEISGVYELASGQLIKMPPVDQRTPEWFTNHSWRIKPGAIEKLKTNARNQVVFLCGAARNDKDYWDLFDVAICLDVSESTLRLRIANRRDNDYGKSEHELQQILEWHKKATSNYRLRGALVIDADRSLNQVISAILHVLDEKLL